MTLRGIWSGGHCRHHETVLCYRTVNKAPCLCGGGLVACFRRSIIVAGRKNGTAKRKKQGKNENKIKGKEAEKDEKNSNSHFSGVIQQNKKRCRMRHRFLFCEKEEKLGFAGDFRSCGRAGPWPRRDRYPELDGGGKPPPYPKPAAFAVGGGPRTPQTQSHTGRRGAGPYNR